VAHDAQTRNEPARLVEIEDDLEDLRVEPLGGLVGADVLAAHALTNLGDLRLELLVRESIRRDNRGRAELHPADVSLVDVHANAKFARVAEDHERLARSGIVELADARLDLKDFSRMRRANGAAFERGFRRFEPRSRREERGVRDRDVFAAARERGLLTR